MKFKFQIFLFIILISPVYSQQQDSISKYFIIKDKLLTSGFETIKWYDFGMIAAVGIEYLAAANSDHKLIKISPFKFEEDIQNKIGMNGRKSFGSIDDWIYPAAVLFTRFAIMAGSEYFGDQIYSVKDYKYPFGLIKSLIYSTFICETAKNSFYKERPDGSDSRSFFSGHSSSSFTVSAYLFREINDYLERSENIKDNKTLKTILKVSAFTSLYGWASYVAYCRLRDNKHYLLDVLTGVTVGTLIGNLTYSSLFSSSKDQKFSIGFVGFSQISISYNF
jgi:membrane-associated phospholipid phosphatase